MHTEEVIYWAVNRIAREAPILCTHVGNKVGCSTVTSLQVMSIAGIATDLPAQLGYWVPHFYVGTLQD